jgi:hypothetical protein
MSTFNRTTLVKVLEILDSSNAGEALAADASRSLP